MADCCSDEDTQFFPAQVVPQGTQVDHTVHHLGDAETMAEVVERIVPVVLLHTQLKQKINMSSKIQTKPLSPVL